VGDRLLARARARGVRRGFLAPSSNRGGDREAGDPEEREAVVRVVAGPDERERVEERRRDLTPTHGEETTEACADRSEEDRGRLVELRERARGDRERQHPERADEQEPRRRDPDRDEHGEGRGRRERERDPPGSVPSRRRDSGEEQRSREDADPPIERDAPQQHDEPGDIREGERRLHPPRVHLSSA